jgi:phosphohistidine phosphatase
VELILVRHGLAVKRDTPGFADEDRPLTEDGIERMQKAARGLARFIDPPDIVISSPLVRARQTAEILAQALQCNHDVAEWATLLPDAAPATILPLLKKRAGDVASVILVGHEPHLSHLTALLLGAPEQAIAYKKGGACSLDFAGKPAAETAKLNWFITPKQLRLLA